MKHLRYVFPLLVGLLIAPTQGWADEGTGGALSGEIRVDYTSRYIWRGLDLFPDDDGGFSPQVFFDLFETGLYAGVWSMIPVEDKQRDYQEIDWYGGFANTAFDGESYQIDYDLGYVYYDFPLAHKDVDSQEIIFKMAFPGAIGLEDVALTPYTGVVYTWPVTAKGFTDGWWWNVGLRADLPLPQAPIVQAEQALNLYTETWYTDSGAQYGIDPGFTHLASGVRTTWAVGPITITPGLHYSWTWESSLNSENEIWADASISYHF